MGRGRDCPEETKEPKNPPGQAMMVKVGNAILHGLHISFSDVVKGIPSPILIMIKKKKDSYYGLVMKRIIWTRPCH